MCVVRRQESGYLGLQRGGGLLVTDRGSEQMLAVC